MSTFKTGQDVAFIVQDGEWVEGRSGPYFCDWGYTSIDGRVLSVGDGVVAIWPDDGKAPRFVKMEDVFDARDYDGLHARIHLLNINEYGHADGRWAAERGRSDA